MYPHVIQFETRRQEVERELRLMGERAEAQLRRGQLHCQRDRSLVRRQEAATATLQLPDHGKAGTA